MSKSNKAQIDLWNGRVGDKWAAMQIGPSGSALAEASNEFRAVAAERLTVALAPHDMDSLVTLAGAIWVVEAVRTS
jgi:hypothetical protein